MHAQRCSCPEETVCYLAKSTITVQSTQNVRKHISCTPLIYELTKWAFPDKLHQYRTNAKYSTSCQYQPSVLWRCWLGGRKGIRPVKNWVVGCWHGVCLEQGADLHMAQLMPLPLTVSCFSKIQIGFYLSGTGSPGSPRKRAVKRVCVCVCVSVPGQIHDSHLHPHLNGHFPGRSVLAGSHSICS